MAGRFAPSPTSDLHLGNLRTALVAWLMARSTGRRFVMRVEDLDAQRVAAAGDAERRQLADLTELGLDWDGPVVRQSDRLRLYERAAAELPTYECFCTRRKPRPRRGSGPTGHLPAPARRTRPAGRSRPLSAGGGQASGSGRTSGRPRGGGRRFVIRRATGPGPQPRGRGRRRRPGSTRWCGAPLLTSVPRQAS